MNSKQRRKAIREFDRTYPYSYAYNHYITRFANYDAWAKNEIEIQKWIKEKKVDFRYKDGKICFNKKQDYIYFMLKFV